MTSNPLFAKRDELMEVLSEPYFTLIDLQEFKDEVTQVVGSISSQMVKFDLVSPQIQPRFLIIT